MVWALVAYFGWKGGPIVNLVRLKTQVRHFGSGSRLHDEILSKAVLDLNRAVAYVRASLLHAITEA